MFKKRKEDKKIELLISQQKEMEKITNVLKNLEHLKNLEQISKMNSYIGKIGDKLGDIERKLKQNNDNALEIRGINDSLRLIAFRTPKTKEEKERDKKGFMSLEEELKNFWIWKKENEIKENKFMISQIKNEKEQLRLVKNNLELEKEIELIKKTDAKNFTEGYNIFKKNQLNKKTTNKKEVK